MYSGGGLGWGFFHWPQNLATLFAFLILLAASISPLFAQPTTKPDSTPPELMAMATAYRNLKSLSLAGTIDLSADVDGQKIEHHDEFTAAFAAPMRFKHEVKRDAVVSATGGKAYLYLPAYNTYSIEDGPNERGAYDDLSDDFHNLLMSQNPSLDLALVKSPVLEMLVPATSMTAAPDVQIDGRAFHAYTLIWPDRDLTLVLDPATHLLRRVIVNQARMEKDRGADVRKAVVTIDYTRTEINGNIPNDALSFVPPPTAEERETPIADPMSLMARRVPHFRLSSTDSADVSDAALRGRVYVLIFWASWSNPAATFLPAMEELYAKAKAANVRFFAIDQQEPLAAVKRFVTQNNITMPVLLDSDGKASISFGADSLPETVVVGRDGMVKKVYVGVADPADVQTAIDAALAEKQTPAP